jgi:hypothetical protein
MAPTQMLIIAAIVIWMIVKRFAGSPVGSRSLLVPLVLTGYGLVTLAQTHPAIGATGIVLLAVEALVSVGTGMARAVTIKLFVRDGHLWQRYTPLTLGVWIVMIGIRIGFLVAGHGMGISLPEGATVMFSFGLSMVFESLFVAKRAAATGAAIMPRQPRRSRAGIR